jgi:NADH dehydrogenase [ubiquinone] 1 alpha subcomplex assembly factor 7
MNTKENSVLVELGGGRGTLMNDLLRAAKIVEGFMPAQEIYFVERSALLKNKQKQNVPNANFVETVAHVPAGKPLYLVANEFLDALPLRQFMRTAKGWQERLVGLEKNKLTWQLGDKINATLPKAPIGTVAEICPAAEDTIREIAARIKQDGGLAVLIDYGTQEESALGDTLQAVKRHQFHAIFDEPGQADITAHVRFAKLKEIAEAEGAKVLPLQTQKAFLEGLGIKQRAESLAAHANIEEQQNISAALKRLTAPAQMGELFKVMMITHA